MVIQVNDEAHQKILARCHYIISLLEGDVDRLRKDFDRLMENLDGLKESINSLDGTI